jgi:hypothetical protein
MLQVLCHTYNHQCNLPRKEPPPQRLQLPQEAFCFGEDEYIRVISLIGEAFYGMKRYQDAIDKFELAKRKAQAEVVYDKPF